MLWSSLEQFVAERKNANKPAAHNYVGYSGGLDSTVLLCLLSERMPVGQLTAVHINHQLSDYADEWQQHCEQWCEQLGVPFICHRVSVAPDGGGLEEAARRARYQVFEQLLNPGDALWLGHHLDDQAETLLLRLMRGSGVRGLSAMAARRPLAGGELLRPLLDCGRDQLQQYAEQHALRWIEDDSNDDHGFDRNFLRHQVMPLLQQRWPGFAQRWQQTAEQMSETDATLIELADGDLQRLDLQTEKVGMSIRLGSVTDLSWLRWKECIRRLAHLQGLPLPERVHLKELQQQLSSPRADAKLSVSWRDCEVNRVGDRLVVHPKLSVIDPGLMVDWGGAAPLQWGDWRLQLVPSDSGFLIPDGGFQVTLRQHGERAHPQGRQHSQSVKKLLQEYRVPIWLRDQLPVLRVSGKVVCFADLWVEKEAFCDSGNLCRLQWQYSPVIEVGG